MVKSDIKEIIGTHNWWKFAKLPQITFSQPGDTVVSQTDPISLYPDVVDTVDDLNDWYNDPARLISGRENAYQRISKLEDTTSNLGPRVVALEADVVNINTEIGIINGQLNPLITFVDTYGYFQTTAFVTNAMLQTIQVKIHQFGKRITVCTLENIAGLTTAAATLLVGNFVFGSAVLGTDHKTITILLNGTTVFATVNFVEGGNKIDIGISGGANVHSVFPPAANIVIYPFTLDFFLV